MYRDNKRALTSCPIYYIMGIPTIPIHMLLLQWRSVLCIPCSALNERGGKRTVCGNLRE